MTTYIPKNKQIIRKKQKSDSVSDDCVYRLTNIDVLALEAILLSPEARHIMRVLEVQDKDDFKYLKRVYEDVLRGPFGAIDSQSVRRVKKLHEFTTVLNEYQELIDNTVRKGYSVTLPRGESVKSIFEACEKIRENYQMCFYKESA